MPHNITTVKQEHSPTAQNIIPLNSIRIPSTITATNSSKVYIYIPKFEYIHLSQGKNFENGFWSINFNDIATTNIITTNEIQSFQLLLIYKSISDDEILSNIYYTKETGLTSGPFITASYTKTSSTNINLRIQTFTEKSNTTFQITGLPPLATLNTGKKVEYDETTPIWEIPANKATNITINLNAYQNQSPSIDKLNLNITATNSIIPKYKTTFTLIIDLNDKHKIPHKTQYKELKINALDILHNTQIPFTAYILSIKDLPEYCCIPNAIKIGNKWVLGKNHNHRITINNFRKTHNEFYITLEYIILNENLIIPTNENTYTTKIKCDFKDKPLITKDYTKCIICKNCDRCKLFENFMEYIGNSTILRHILK